MLGHKNAREKLAAFLLEMSDRIAPGEADFRLPMSRYDIADYLCLSPETVCRNFTQMISDGLISLPDSQTVQILHRAPLEFHRPLIWSIGGGATRRRRRRPQHDPLPGRGVDQHPDRRGPRNPQLGEEDRRRDDRRRERRGQQLARERRAEAIDGDEGRVAGLGDAAGPTDEAHHPHPEPDGGDQATRPARPAGQARMLGPRCAHPNAEARSTGKAFQTVSSGCAREGIGFRLVERRVDDLGHDVQRSGRRIRSPAARRSAIVPARRATPTMAAGGNAAPAAPRRPVASAGPNQASAAMPWSRWTGRWRSRSSRAAGRAASQRCP